MRRIAILALTAALTAGGASAALAQPGPPSDVPAPAAEAGGSAETGETNSADGRARASGQAGFEVPANGEASVDGRAFGQARAAEARERGGDDDAEPQGSPATGQQRSAEARAHASERAGFTVPANGAPEDRDSVEESDSIDPDSLPDAGELPEGLPEIDGTELPDEARGVLESLLASLTQVLETLEELFGLTPEVP
ncbi:MAG: hypothetical protein WD250_02465 [Egibacteraceae bacterium]